MKVKVLFPNSVTMSKKKKKLKKIMFPKNKVFKKFHVFKNK